MASSRRRRKREPKLLAVAVRFVVFRTLAAFISGCTTKSIARRADASDHHSVGRGCVMGALRGCLVTASAARRNFARQFAVLLGALCSLSAAGCAQVTVVSQDAPPRTEWKYGVLAIDLGSSKNNTIVSTSGLGLISGPSVTALGYTKARVVRIGDECRVVITANDPESLKKDEELFRRLKATREACAG
jgi:hypothetical protein